MARHRSDWGELNFAISGIMEIGIEGVCTCRRRSTPSGYRRACPTAARTRAKSTTPASTSPRRPAPACRPLLHAGDQPRHARRAGRFRAARHHLSGYAGRPAHGAGGDRPDAPGARYASYLPSTTELPLAPILAALQREPGDKRGAAHWAATAGITERTLLRHCQQHLGMSFNDWRQRLRGQRAGHAGRGIAGAGRRAPARLQHALGVHRDVPTADRGIARQRAAARRRRAAGIAVGHCAPSAAPGWRRAPANRVIHASDARHGRTRDNSA